MVTKFTPGPWAHEPAFRRSDLPDALTAERIYAKDPGPEFSFTVGYAVDVDAPTRIANSNLIVAAPDMYEALKGVLPFMEAAESAGLVGDEGCFWPVEAVRAALAQADGKQAQS